MAYVERSVDDINEGGRLKIAQELLTTEETYVTALETMLISFKLPLVAKRIISVEVLPLPIPCVR